MAMPPRLGHPDLALLRDHRLLSAGRKRCDQGRALGPDEDFDVRYLPNGSFVLGAAVVDRPVNTPLFSLVDPQHHWKAAIAARNKSMKLAPVGNDPCAARVAVLHGTWARGH